MGIRIELPEYDIVMPEVRHAPSDWGGMGFLLFVVALFLVVSGIVHL